MSIPRYQNIPPLQGLALEWQQFITRGGKVYDPNINIIQAPTLYDDMQYDILNYPNKSEPFWKQNLICEAMYQRVTQFAVRHNDSLKTDYITNFADGHKTGTIESEPHTIDMVNFNGNIPYDWSLSFYNKKTNAFIITITGTSCGGGNEV